MTIDGEVFLDPQEHEYRPPGSTPRQLGDRISPTPQQYERMQKDTQAAKLRVQGYTYREISEIMQESQNTSATRVRRAIAAVPVEAVEELRRIQVERFDFQRRVALRILAEDRPLVQNGRVVTYTDDQGQVKPVIDLKPRLAALGELRKIEDSVARLCGTEAPKRVDVNVITEDAVDAEIQRLERELAANSRGTPGEAGPLTGVTEAES